MVCTFFGHRDTPDSIRKALYETLNDLIVNHGADTFYIGSQGNFDRMVISELEKLFSIYPHIKCYIVLAYMPKSNEKYCFDTIYPDGLESVPPKFALDKRNRIMLEWSDIVITYVGCNFGGAAKFKAIAEKKGKQVINLYQ